jgi:hypothetical protein
MSGISGRTEQLITPLLIRSMLLREHAYISIMNKLRELYQKWKEYIRVDIVMYLVMIILFILIIIFYL